MTDAIGRTLADMDEAAAEMGRSRERETVELCNTARDIAAAARRWAPKDPERAATLILESVFDDRTTHYRSASVTIIGLDLTDPPAWRFLKACVDREFLPPREVVRAQLKASVEVEGGKS